MYLCVEGAVLYLCVEGAVLYLCVEGAIMYLCVDGIDCAFVSTFFRLYFRIVPSVCEWLCICVLGMSSVSLSEM